MNVSVYECERFMNVKGLWMWKVYECERFMNVKGLWMW